MISGSQGAAHGRAGAKFLSAAQLCERWGIARTTLYALRRDGYVPQPVKLGARAVRWSIDEIVALELRMAADRARGSR